MELDQQTLEKLEKMVGLLDQQVSKKDFATNLELVLQLMTKVIRRVEDAMSGLEGTFTNALNRIQTEHSSTLADIHSKVDHVFVGQRMDAMQQEHNARMAAVDSKISAVRDGAPGPKGDQGLPGRNGRDGKDGLNGSLDPSIRKEIDDLKATIKRIAGSRAGGSRKITYVKPYSLTSQCNGVLKAFTLPKDTLNVLGVFGTQFPITYDPTGANADWTFSGNTLTLGAAVGAPATGQTLWALIEVQFYY